MNNTILEIKKYGREKNKKFASKGMLGKKHSKTTKEKMRKKRLLNPIRYWLGKKLYPETIKKIRQKSLEQFKNGMPEKTKQKMRGRVSWNKNLTKEIDERVKKMGEATSKGRQGIKLTKKNKENIGKSNKGKHFGLKTETTKEKMRNNHADFSGKNNPNWQNGKSFEEYPQEFNNELKEKIRKRDNHRCQECFRHQDEIFTKSGKRKKLVIHHIDYDKKNNNPNNLISLCQNCHMQTNYKRKDWINYFQEKMLKK